MENEALANIKNEPALFYSYAKKFSKGDSTIANLKYNGVIFIQDKDKADILQKQYASMWSKPMIRYKNEDMTYFFSKCYECECERFISVNLMIYLNTLEILRTIF